MKIEGKGGISAEIVADSVSPWGKRITTFVLEYPRFIHAEFMTHRMISKNSASSRAIPVAKVIEQVMENAAMPIHWGKNQTGMQAKEELDTYDKLFVQEEWDRAASHAIDVADYMSRAGAHKQIVNRILEPFQFMRVVATATEWENFFWLRDHPDAQPEIAELARVMREVQDKSIPVNLETGEWHLPFVWCSRDAITDEIGYHIGEVGEESHKQLTVEDALKVSASCCAQVSFRKSDTSLEKALAIWDRLVDSEPVHASPFEHQAKVMQKEHWNTEDEYGVNDHSLPGTWERGITHTDKECNLWSGNFQGWVQHRQLIPNHVRRG